jgi:protein-tyrosine kinase
MKAVAPSLSAAHVSMARDCAPRGVAEQIVSLVDPESVAADQYRALRYNLETLRKEAQLQTIAVTSPAPGDGKTVTTLNLAGTLAQARESRVLIIDADLRRPNVANYLGLGNSRRLGLADALRDHRYELDDIVCHLTSFNLWMVPAGLPERAPYELLNSPRLEMLLRAARRDFDCVLIDTPPTVPLPDCRLLERWVDGFILVVAAHRTPRRMVVEALNQLEGAKMLGVVFNADDRSHSGYYGYYGYYADHGSSAGSRSRTSWWRRFPDQTS